MWRSTVAASRWCLNSTTAERTQAAQLLRGINRQLASEAGGGGGGGGAHWGLNHIALAVPNLEQAADTFRDAFGLNVSAPQTLPEHGVRVVFVQLANTKLELLEPLDETSPISNFLKKNPSGGMHHMCLDVPNIKTAIEEVQDKVRLLDAKPKIGAHGTPVVFIHPKSVCGVLTELEEAKKSKL